MRQLVAAEVAVPLLDTDGRSLRLSNVSTNHRAVASLVVVLPHIPADPLAAHLEVLAASHRVRIENSSGVTITETVACDTGNVDVNKNDAAALPAQAAWTTLDHTVAFSSSIVDGDRAITAAVEAIAGLDPDRSIAVRFPGNDMAYTAIELVSPAPESIAWRTWHLYPGPNAHVVTTSTTASTVVRPALKLDLHSSDLQGVS